MAETTKASYARIGFTVFIGILAIVGTLIYLGGVRGNEECIYAETYYVKSVSGLAVGSPVNFRGVKVGEVCEIGFVGNRYLVGGETNNLVLVKMSFPMAKLLADCEPSVNTREVAETLLRDPTLRATVTASGITGLSRIELDRQPDVDALPISWHPKCVYIPPAVSLLDSFSDSATRVMNQINKMNFTEVWSNVSVAVQSLERVSGNAQTMMETRMHDLDKIATDVSTIVGSVRDLVEDLKDNPSLLIRERVREPLPETE